MGFLCQACSKIGGIAVFAPCCLMFFVAGGELFPVCPIYALWQSGQVSLYRPEHEYLSWA